MDEISPLVAFYGDDFTGSTDALAQFYSFGLKGILLFDCPDTLSLTALSQGMDVVGIAGISRSLPTLQLEGEVRPVLEALKKLRSKIVQYKVCSTFDSSIETGSLGRVIEIAHEIFGPLPVPIVAAQPDFGRYTIFGQHFAKGGEQVYRLDRHPTMSKHPITPMKESDLVQHLQSQTERTVAGLYLLQMTGSLEEAQYCYDEIVKTCPTAVIFDALEMSHLVRIAEVIWPSDSETRFVMGSGGLSYGIGAYLNKSRILPEYKNNSVLPVDNVLVVSGSAAPQTQRQISWALENGWHGLRLNLLSLIEFWNPTVNAILSEVLEALKKGENVVVYTALGPSDRCILKAREALQVRGIRLHELTELIGRAFGKLIQISLQDSNLRRIIVAGGDTSGYTMKAVDAYGLEIVKRLVPNGPLCTLRSFNSMVDGCEILLKGGQVGNDELFEVVRQGTAIN